MITANEIRYGNWVQNQNGYPIRVNYHFFGMIERLGKDRSDASSGIPLSPTILEKCGFEKRDIDGQPYFSTGKVDIAKDNSSDGYFLITEDAHEGNLYWLGNPFYFLHQVQNLFFALTGIELNYLP